MTADKTDPAGVRGAATAATATATTMPRPGLRWLRLKRAPWRTLMGQFFLVSTVLLLLSMAVQGAWIARTIEAKAKHHAGSAAALFIEHFLAPHLSDVGTTGQLTPEQERLVARVITTASVHMRVVALKIWSLDGSLIYTTLPNHAAEPYALSESLHDAIEGNVGAEFDRLGDDDIEDDGIIDPPLLEVYVPLRDRENNVTAVIEFYQDAQALRRQLDATVNYTLIITALACLCMIAGLSVIFGRASKVIDGQRLSLVNKVRELSRALRQNMLLQARAKRAAQLAAEENERFLLSLGADLHDGPAQLVGYALLRLDALGVTDDEPHPGAADDLEAIRAALQDALTEVRDICAGLSMPELEKLSLECALRATIAEHERRTRTTVGSSIDADLPTTIPHFVKVGLCRFVQEGLNNAFKHAGGQGQFVKAWIDADTIVVRVQDAGPGMPSGPASRQHRRLGLAGLTNRIESWGGTVHVNTAAGGGTRLTAVMPVVSYTEGIAA